MTPQQSNYSAWDVNLTEESNRGNFSEVAPCVVAHAHLAPNTHNTQPWYFIADSATQSIDVYIVSERVLPESDKLARQAHISIGAAIKNLEVAAHALGWSVNMDIAGADGGRIATLRLEYNAEAGPLANLVENIRARMTNRARYDRSKTLSPEFESRLESIAEGHGVELRLIKDKFTKTAIADLQEKADSVVINNTKFATELADWIITEDSDSGLGMPGSGFGLAKDKIESVITSLRNGLSSDLDLRKALPQADREGINSAYAELIILARNDSLISRLQSGMAFQQVALELTGIHWASAMNAAFVEVQAFSMLLKARLRDFRNSPMIACRIGEPLAYEAGEVVRSHSPRLPLGEIFLLK